MTDNAHTQAIQELLQASTEIHHPLKRGKNLVSGLEQMKGSKDRIQQIPYLDINLSSL